MAKHRRQLESEECNRMTVERESLWEDCVVFFKQHKFNPKFSLRVKFFGEDGLDAGGLRREFGSVLIKKMFSSDAMLFEGDDERKDPIYDADAVHSNLFLARKICAYLLSHLDISVSCLSPVVYSYISTGEVHEASKECTVEGVPDYDVRRFIHEVISELFVNAKVRLEGRQHLRHFPHLIHIVPRPPPNFLNHEMDWGNCNTR